MSEPKPVYTVTATYQRLTADEQATIDRLWDDGCAIKHIGRVIGRPSQCVSQYLVRTGQHTPVSVNAPAAYRERAIDWYQRGISVKDITRHFHISPKTVYRDLRQRNIPLRNPAMSRSAR